MNKHFRHQLRPIRSRQRWGLGFRCAAWGLLLGSIGALLLGITQAGLDVPGLTSYAVGLLLVTPVLGLVAGLAWPRGWSDAACAVDRHYAFKDRTATALEFSSKQETTTLHELQIGDALEHLDSVDAKEVVSIGSPGLLAAAVVALLLAVPAMLLPSGSQNVDASPAAPLNVVVEQAQRAEAELEELQEFAKENQEPETEKLVEQLRQLIEEMKQPGVDAREALAKLSEMQATIQQQQSQYNVAQVDAQMKAVGEALALAEQTAPAGKAMIQGEMEKAADQLEELESPELDRQTEKAVKEQLQRVATNAQNTGLESLADAAKSLCEGIGHNNASFRDGTKRLAGECRKHGVRKRLHDLLRSQCECLSECKSECESACRTKGNANGKGGKNWGLGASDNELADRTDKLNGQQEKLTGQQSGEGEVESETIHAPEGQQQAQREYRESFLEYEKLNEAVLESEPIPLGHRQTIRRYFESIRPQQGELPSGEE